MKYALITIICISTFYANAQQWTESGTNDISNANAGNVGIGTSSPSQKLEIVGSAKLSNSLILGNKERVNALQLAGEIYFDQNYHPDYPAFTGGNGGGLSIYNEDGWGAIIATNNMQWITPTFDGGVFNGNVSIGAAPNFGSTLEVTGDSHFIGDEAIFAIDYAEFQNDLFAKKFTTYEIEFMDGSILNSASGLGVSGLNINQNSSEVIFLTLDHDLVFETPSNKEIKFNSKVFATGMYIEGGFLEPNDGIKFADGSILNSASGLGESGSFEITGSEDVTLSTTGGDLWFDTPSGNEIYFNGVSNQNP